MVTRSCDLHCGHCYAEAGRRAKLDANADAPGAPALRTILVGYEE